MDRRATPTWSATATSGTSDATPTPAWRTSAGRTPGTRSPTATAGCPVSRGPPARCRGTRTTPRSARRGWPGSSGTTRRFADRLEREAAELKERFNRDWWVADGEYYALALDRGRPPGRRAHVQHRPPAVERHRRPTSGPRKVAEHLVGPRLFSGWGVRTLAEGEAPVQPDRLPQRHGLAVRQLVHRLGPAPVRLHRGGGHDRRRHPATRPSTSTAGCRRRSAAIERELTKFPVEYPTACSPQAWSTGSAAAAAADHARAGAARGAPGGRARCCRSAWAGSRCWTSRAAGGGWTRSPGAGWTCTSWPTDRRATAGRAAGSSGRAIARPCTPLGVDQAWRSCLTECRRGVSSADAGTRVPARDRRLQDHVPGPRPAHERRGQPPRAPYRRGGAGQQPRQLPRLHLLRVWARSDSRRLVRFMAKQEVFAAQDRRSADARHEAHPGEPARPAPRRSTRRSTRCKRGEVVGVFPEATISRSFTVKELKSGTARMAAGRRGADPAGRGLGHPAALDQGPPAHLTRRHTPITILIGEPMHPGEHP